MYSRHEPLIQLTRLQSTGVIVGMLAIVIVVFVAGVVVGRRSADPVPAVLARIAPGAADGTSAARLGLGKSTSRSQRAKAMSAISPNTAVVHDSLRATLGPPQVRDKAAAARIEAHRQLDASRRHGIAGVEQPGAGGNVNALPSEALEVAGAGEATFYALAMSTFGDRRPARSIVTMLNDAGHKARITPVTQGERTMYRVEIGRFKTPQDAALFQQRFEAEMGYPTVLVSARAPR